ncbi:fumarylacetoacetate hydrolase family protein [Verticiella sediminum]|uniref:Fumarylacetoacetate hydrolase family protein n=1 Tax=Verticiella sediminum TaxID=1247510 RepID=A0A556AEC3_9BURK|nr:fumarylacetoacetate hydrolase family protein [Verticiella sediminum]TSH91229.1 fumarylacetoacetate hydrolase family protein [Verticiella sediminum]
MKLSTFDIHGSRHIGALVDEHTISVFEPSHSPYFADMLALIDGGADALEHARQLARRPVRTVDLAQARLLAPLPRPRQMRDCYSFEQHAKQARTKRHLFGVQGFPTDPDKVELPAIWYERPLYYKCNVHSVAGHDAVVQWPRYADTLDYELEFAMVTGVAGKNIARQDASRHIFGYCIYNDFSARDEQYREMAGGLGPAKSKDFDTGNVLGPWLVTADEIPDPYGMRMRAWVNGELWSEGSSSTMYHRFDSILHHVSSDETILPGEVFGSGTVGNGCGLELGRFLADGDIVELEVEGLGRLRNRVHRPAP